MLNVIFWYTGLVFWVSVVVGVACFAAVDAKDRAVRRRRFRLR